MTLPVISYILFAVAAVAVIYVCTFYLGRVRRVARCVEACNEADIPDEAALPAASVIVYSSDNSINLEACLRSILAQDYAPGFEVIVVNEGSSEDTRGIVGRLKVEFPELYLTFTPDGARSLSRKKLALTIGVKAARNSVVVITDAFTVVPSTRWLAAMMRHFADPAIGVVLGYNAPDAEADSGFGSYTRAFDYAASAVTWLSQAIDGKPYRGCGRNVAYRRQLFFDNKGFSRSLNLRHGDDDIFINEITDGDNTAVELSTASQTRWVIYRPAADIRNARLASSFTGRMVPKGARRAMAAGEWMSWIAIGAAVAAALMAGVTNIAGWSIAGVLILSDIIFLIATWRRTLIALSSKPLLLSIPSLDMTRPLRNVMLTLRSHLGHFKNFTWD